jgi:hypothetical protein
MKPGDMALAQMNTYDSNDYKNGISSGQNEDASESGECLNEVPNLDLS